MRGGQCRLIACIGYDATIDQTITGVLYITLPSLIFSLIVPHGDAMLVKVSNSLVLSIIQPVEPLTRGDFNLPTRRNLTIKRGGSVTTSRPDFIQGVGFRNLRHSIYSFLKIVEDLEETNTIAFSDIAKDKSAPRPNLFNGYCTTILVKDWTIPRLLQPSCCNQIIKRIVCDDSYAYRVSSTYEMPLCSYW